MYLGASRGPFAWLTSRPYMFLPGDGYPCLLNIWAGYCGTVLLLNTYLWRCWELYYIFTLTNMRIQNLAIEDMPWFLRHRWSHPH